MGNSEGISALPLFELKQDPNWDSSFFKNPLNEFNNQDREVPHAPKGEDHRQPVRVGDGVDSVVALEIYDKENHLLGQCSGTISKIEGYSNEGSVVVSAAHCFPDKAASVVAYGDYETPQGDYSQFRLFKGEFQVHPDFKENNPNSPGEIKEASTDMAVIHFDQMPPKGVLPANFAVMDAIDNDIGSMSLRGTPVASVGYSSDLNGISMDNSCYIDAPQQGQAIMTDCDGAPGSSGGPVFLRDDEGNLLLGDNDAPIAIALNSNGEGNTSGKTILSKDFTDAVDFLNKEDSEAVIDNDQRQPLSVEFPKLSFPPEFQNFETWKHEQPNGEFKGRSLGTDVNLGSDNNIKIEGTFKQSAQGYTLPYQMPDANQSFTITPAANINPTPTP